MSYTALYRKFRPQNFEDVKGQEHIVTTLKNQIKADRIGHAYLFCGTRGTGKTTIAKILAKAVNCEHPIDGSPCNECPTCRAINAGASMNVVEIDAASNNGVDNIREIREEVAYRPTQGRYKVYIIDEVHMLSAGAFNALLKTLEEPPSYVIFILATTEVHKIPITILSRCQRYDFKRITVDTIADRLRELMEKEGNDVEDKAIRYIAKAADGSMRDALSLLDQCIAFYLGEKLTYEKVLENLGAVDTDVFSRLLREILSQHTSQAIKILEDLIIRGRELGQFVTDFIWYLRNLLLQGVPVALTELGMWIYMGLRYNGTSYSKEMIQHKRNKLLLIAHGIATAVNVGKVIITQNPVSLNLIMIIRTFHLVWKVLSEELSLTNKAVTKEAMTTMKAGMRTMSGIRFFINEMTTLEHINTKAVASPMPMPLSAEDVVPSVGHIPKRRTNVG